jgi:hypothetical protein
MGVRPHIQHRPSRQGPRRSEARGWMVVDMKTGWNVIYPLERYTKYRTQPGETMGTFPGTTALLPRLCPQATP